MNNIPDQSNDERRQRALEALKQAQAQARAGSVTAKPCEIEEVVPLADYDALGRAEQALVFKQAYPEACQVDVREWRRAQGLARLGPVGSSSW